ncbi:MAG: hypothetical protein RRZ93_02085 [Ruthenibacterium sp.]
MLKGVIIKESLRDENILDEVTIDSAEIWQTEDKPRYWTAIHFSTQDVTFPKKLSKVMDKNWFCDMKYGSKIKVLVFRGRVMQYTIGNEIEKAAVLKYCKKIGIPPEQMNWDE